MNDNIRFCAEWIRNSGLQDKDGGFYSWYDLKENMYGYLYSEITGYGISALLFINSMKKDSETINKAERAARWLVREAMDERGGIKARKYHIDSGDTAYSFKEGWIYAFDCGMVLCGLMNLWEVTRKKVYLLAAEKMGRFLVDKMQRPDGGFYAYYKPSEEKGFDTPEKWSSQSGSYHSKLSLGLIKLGMATGDKTYEQCAEAACSSAIKYYRNGRFITSRRDNSTHMHPHCYTIEGLVFAGNMLKRKRFLDYAAKATAWALDLQDANGGIPYIYFPDKGAVNYQRTDALSQVLRAGNLLFTQGLINKKYEIKLKRLADRLCEFQHLNEDRQKGGFIFGYDFDGKKQEHLNSWCSMFALQAMILHRDKRSAVENTINFLI